MEEERRRGLYVSSSSLLSAPALPPLCIYTICLQAASFPAFAYREAAIEEKEETLTTYSCEEKEGRKNYCSTLLLKKRNCAYISLCEGERKKWTSSEGKASPGMKKEEEEGGGGELSMRVHIRRRGEMSLA